MSHAHPPPARRRPHAQSLVEFALTAPLLVLIVVSVIELGIMFSIYTGLTNTAREAARSAAVYRYSGAMPTNASTAQVAGIDAQRRLAMSSALTATLNPIIRSAGVTMTVAYIPERNTTALLAENPLRAGDTVSVTLQYSHRLLWGLFGPRDLMLQTTTAARLEPGGGN